MEWNRSCNNQLTMYLVIFQSAFEGDLDLCHLLVKALEIREKYMAMSLQSFCQITSRALHRNEVDYAPIARFEPEYPGSKLTMLSSCLGWWLCSAREITVSRFSVWSISWAPTWWLWVEVSDETRSCSCIWEWGGLAAWKSVVKDAQHWLEDIRWWYEYSLFHLCSWTSVMISDSQIASMNHYM